MLQRERLVSALKGDFFKGNLILLEEAASTNLTLKELAQKGAPEGTAVFCERQSAGRGRLGRSFHSPAGEGIYMSVLLRPKGELSQAAALTSLAGVCVAQAIEEVCGLAPGIKWVNDVQVGGKKVCGILIESVIENGAPAWLVLGIGINVNSDLSSFPPELREAATSLRAEAGHPFEREDLAAALLDRLEDSYRKFPQNLPRVRQECRRRMVTLGQRVVIRGQEEGEVYLAEDIDEQFGLVVRNEQGERQILRSGEVSVRPAPKK